MKKVKIVVGANYGDESKGLVTHQFCKDAIQTHDNTIVIFHNGSAQRGHTVDYNPDLRHVYHHFGCGTAEGLPTYFADTFWVHPMEYYREYGELLRQNIHPPITQCSPKAKVITPFDMIVDHATEAYIGWQNGEREHGSCGYGTWCATDREFFGHKIYTIEDYLKAENNTKLGVMLRLTFYDCLTLLQNIRNVDLDKIPEYAVYFEDETRIDNTINHFIDDLKFFMAHNEFFSFDSVYYIFDNLIFEGAQGLGLDKDCGKEWHTTSSTGLTNPYNMLKDKENFNAEVCYVSRAYNTRHGIGDLEEETNKSSINKDMEDKTNVHNEFQGSLRYGYIDDAEREKRILKDYSIVEKDNRFFRTNALTHCNEFPEVNSKLYNYASFNPYSVLKG
jgi:adenylosuccinate synthase